MPPEPQINAHKLLGIEILRFICAFAILVSHYQHFSYLNDKSVPLVLEQQPFFNVLSLFYLHGSFGVQIFWTISGFIFFWKYGGLISQKSISFKIFAERRFSRLYPLHFVTLLFIAATQYLYTQKFGAPFVYEYNDLKHFIMQLFLASGWGLQNGYSFNGPIWSISLEIIAYAFFFICARFIGTSLIKTLIILVTSAIVMSHHWIDTSIAHCIFYFYIGGVTMHVYNIAGSLPLHLQKSSLYAAAVVLALFIMLQILHPLKAAYFLTLFIPIAIYLLLKTVQPVRERTAAVITALGNMTYSSYLLHFPLQILIVYTLRSLGITIPFYNSLFFMSFIGLTFVLAHLCYRYFEMPAQTHIRRVFE